MAFISVACYGISNYYSTYLPEGKFALNLGWKVKDFWV